MNYHNITKDDMLNGEGLRVVLWVSGCEHACPQCQNPITWDPNDGLKFDVGAYKEIVEQLNQDYTDGLTLSGGDPMYPNNRPEVLELCKKIKRDFTNKTIWMYTGYVFEDVRDEPVLKYIDVLVDGEFISNLKDEKIHWVGSSNQRVIDVQRTLQQGKITTLAK